MLKFLIFVLLNLCCTTFIGQPINTSEINNKWLKIDDNILYCNATNNSTIKFENSKTINEHNFKQNHKLQFTIHNNKNIEDSLYFFVGHWLQFEMYKKLGEQLQKVEVRNIHLPILLQLHPFGIIKLSPNETATFEIIPNVKNFNYQFFKPTLIRPSHLSTFGFYYYYESHKIYLLITLLFLGFMLAAFIYATCSYLLQHTVEHLYYGIYALFFLLYFSSKLYFLSVTDYAILKHAYFTVHFLQIFGYVFYGFFIISLLKLSKKNSFLYRLLISFAFIVFLYVITDALLIYKFNEVNASMHMFVVFRYILLTVSLLTIYSLLKVNSKIHRYIASGVFMLFFFGLISLINKNSTSIIHPVYNNFFDVRIALYQIGITVELVLFTIALQYNILQNNKERVLEMEALRLETKQKEMQNFIAIMQAKDMERTRIAQEIHDDIGSGLTNIRLLSEIAKAKSLNTANDTIALNKISNSANELIENMNEIIWSINAKNDNLHNLIAYVRSYIVKYFEDYEHYILKFDIGSNIPNIDIEGSFRRSLFLVIKEALHNIVKHSNATNVFFQVIMLPNNKLNIVIADNGKGYNCNNNVQFSNGLRNMRERINLLNGIINIKSNKGVIIHIQIPLGTTTK